MLLLISYIFNISLNISSFKYIVSAPPLYLQLYDAAQERHSITNYQTSKGQQQLQQHLSMTPELQANNNHSDSESFSITKGIISGETAFKIFTRCSGLTKAQLAEVSSNRQRESARGREK